VRPPLPFQRFLVADTSMRPTLQPGDRVLASRWLSPRVGDIVVVRDPEFRSTHLLKRVERVDTTGGLIVRGDNPNVSRDSRHFGPVPRELIVGRVFVRYLPGERRGWL
jgi:mitochondrial inner membrane protease subunit 1